MLTDADTVVSPVSSVSCRTVTVVAAVVVGAGLFPRAHSRCQTLIYVLTLSGVTKVRSVASLTRADAAVRILRENRVRVGRV